jgi:hypothetical protein
MKREHPVDSAVKRLKQELANESAPPLKRLRRVELEDLLERSGYQVAVLRRTVAILDAQVQEMIALRENAARLLDSYEIPRQCHSNQLLTLDQRIAIAVEVGRR